MSCKKGRKVVRRKLGFGVKGGQTITINGIKLKIMMRRAGKVMKWGGFRYRYNVIVRNLNTGKEEKFAFYGSIAEYMGQADRTEPLTAFGMILDDAIVCINCRDYRDVMNEFGYTDSKEAKRVYKSCCNTYKKLRKLGLTDDDMFTGVNKIIDMGKL